MILSIIICTRDRADSLVETLRSISQVAAPDHCGLELLVVDNGSTDHTRSVVESAVFKNGVIRYVFEPKPGLSVARNRGVKEARGEIIVFTDDDVRVPPNWLVDLTYPIRSGRADAVAGGVLFPEHVRCELRAWPLDDRWSWFASTADLNAERPERMVGANMAFHRRVLREVPCFDECLGAGALGFYEDTLFAQQLVNAGYALVGALNVTVEHHFDTSRLSNRSLKALATRMGRSRAYMFHHWRHQKSRLALVRWCSTAVKAVWRAVGTSFGGEPNRVTGRDLDFEVRRAFLTEYLSIKRQPPRYRRHQLQAPGR